MEEAAEPDCPPGFALRRLLGRGGMGVVYEAEELSLGRRVALKFLRYLTPDDPDLTARLQAEAAAAARLHHPHIVQVHQHGTWRGRPYIVQEYVPGEGLDRRLARAVLDAPAAARLVADLARAVRHAHEQGVVHRDLKPANVLIAADGTPKVTDFGLAKRADDDSGRTRTGAILGTPSYMAPEQAAGEKSVGPPADIYALGAVLYECLTGRPPFRAASALETLEQVRSADPLPLRRFQPQVSRDLETICQKCLEKAPSARYQSAAALADDLERFLRGEPVWARPIGPVVRLLKWVRRRPTAAALVGTLGLAVVGGTAGLLVHNAKLAGANTKLGSALEQATAQEAEARRQKGRADENYRAARDAVRRMLERATARAKSGVPGLLELKREQQEDALAYFAAVIRQQGDPDPGVREDVAYAYRATADVQLQLGQRTGAMASYRRALDLFTELAAEFPGHLRFRDAQAACLNNMSVAGTDAAESERLHSEALAICEELVRARPDNIGFRNALAMGLHNRGHRLYGRGRRAEAAADFRRAAALRAELQARGSPSEQFITARYRAEDLLMLGLSLTGDEGEAALREAEAVLSALREQSPEVDDVTCDLAGVESNLGMMLTDHGRTEEALRQFAKAVALSEPVVRREPQLAKARYTLRNAHGGRALALERANRFREAVADRRRVVELAEPAERAMSRAFLAMILARAGDHQAAATEAGAVAPLPEAANAEWSHYLAQVFGWCAQAAADDTARARLYGDRAIELLRRVRKLAGEEEWRKMAPDLAQDPALVPLRGRLEFQELLNAGRPQSPAAGRPAGLK